MMTALSVKMPERRQGLRGWTQHLRRDKIEVQTCRARGVTLRHVTYTCYSGQISLEKLDDAVGLQRGALVCSSKLEFPPHSGYRRFCSGAFSARLCENFALHVLNHCPNALGLRTALYDPGARSAELLLCLLERCGDVTVVTHRAEPYFCAANRALEETGAAAMITERPGGVENRGLIIAPHGIEEKLPVSGSAVVLTVGQPRQVACGDLFWQYYFKMPNGFADIKPAELSEEYFCSALYTLGAQYALGSIVPLRAGGTADADAARVAKLLTQR